MKCSALLLPFCVAGMLAAQTATAPQPAPAPHARHARAGMVHRLSARLNLTADQRNQARTIFRESRASAKALTPKLRDERMALKTAIKTDNQVQIDRILNQDATLNAQARAIHAKAMAKFYRILTPDQKARFDRMGMHHRPMAAAPTGDTR